jgi:hypothetical protein
VNLSGNVGTKCALLDVGTLNDKNLNGRDGMTLYQEIYFLHILDDPDKGEPVYVFLVTPSLKAAEKIWLKYLDFLKTVSVSWMISEGSEYKQFGGGTWEAPEDMVCVAGKFRGVLYDFAYEFELVGQMFGTALEAINKTQAPFWFLYFQGYSGSTHPPSENIPPEVLAHMGMAEKIPGVNDYWSVPLFAADWGKQYTVAGRSFYRNEGDGGGGYFDPTYAFVYANTPFDDVHVMARCIPGISFEEQPEKIGMQSETDLMYHIPAIQYPGGYWHVQIDEQYPLSEYIILEYLPGIDVRQDKGGVSGVNRNYTLAVGMPAINNSPTWQGSAYAYPEYAYDNQALFVPEPLLQTLLRYGARIGATRGFKI